MSSHKLSPLSPGGRGLGRGGYAASPMTPGLEAAYGHCLRIARNHYENFPVASLFLPRALRAPVAVIYAFARSGDDLADEGTLPPRERLAGLTALGADLDQALSGAAVQDPVPRAAAHVICRYGLPPGPFHDLLTAYRMDVEKRRYADFAELMGYCRYSANPVGRLMLHLTGDATPENLQDSDAICTALQLINFLQDMDQDYRENGRIYLPRDEMAHFGVGEAHIRSCITDQPMRALFAQQVKRARDMLASGAPLGSRLKGRMGFEVRMIAAGGLRVLDKLTDQRTGVFTRPRLTHGDRIGLVWRALSRRAPGHTTARSR